MDIHILHDGKQIGPYSEESVQSLLKQGSVLINDLAWRPGMPEWLPLHAVLYPAAQPAGAPQPPPPPKDQTPPPMPEPNLATPEEYATVAATEPGPEPEPIIVADPASPRQKAFLTYLTIPFQADLTKEKAALMVNDAMENPKNSMRIKRWDEERLRLYPDLFAEEIKARRENRSQQYLEICHGEGVEFFDGVTKAHTQVLVGYLDVRYPTWDHTEQAAKYDYFFPAIAEKFPQLLKKSARGRFKYPDGPKVAAELRSPVAARPKSQKSPVGAMVRGVFFGLLVLGAVVGFMEVQKRGGLAKLQASVKDATNSVAKAKGTPAGANPGNPNTGATPPLATASAGTGSKFDPAPTIPNPATPGATPAAAGNPAATAATTTPTIPAATTTTPEDPSMASMAPAPAPVSTSLFDTTPPAATPAPGAVDATAATATPAPAAPARVMAKITKPTVINLRFGSSTLRPGTPVQVISSNGAMLSIKFGPDTVSIPAANTDYTVGSSAAVAPAPGE